VVNGRPALALSHPIGLVSILADRSIDLTATPDAHFGEGGLSFERILVQSLAGEASAPAGWGASRFSEANIGANRAALPGSWFLVLGSSFFVPLSSFLLPSPHSGFGSLLDAGLREATERLYNVTAGPAVGREF
jgi:hypothetical protein